jgi:hypothetical protein
MTSKEGLPSRQMARLTQEVRDIAQKLSREQMLDLADLLHDEIRARHAARSLRIPESECV